MINSPTRNAQAQRMTRLVQRAEVLRSLFPRPSPEEEECKSCYSLRYDEEALRYVPTAPGYTEDSTTDGEDQQCSICLETIHANREVFGPCGHLYHYDCLMQWMMKDHDECPLCRQGLWDPKSFENIHRVLYPSAPPSRPVPQEEVIFDRFLLFECVILVSATLTLLVGLFTPFTQALFVCLSLYFAAIVFPCLYLAERLCRRQQSRLHTI